MPDQQLVFTALPGIPLIEPGDDLVPIILQGITDAGLELMDGDILVLAQKIVSKSENRLVNLDRVEPSPRALALAAETDKDPRLIQVILSESREIMRTRKSLIIVLHKQGFICANAGVDHSNVRGPGGAPGEWVLRLPEDPDRSAREIMRRIGEATRATIGVLIIDSHGRAWRIGTSGVTIGIAGVPAVADLRGQPDLFGDLLQVTVVGVADELAAGASLLMGQANEARPVIHVRGFPYPLKSSNLHDLIRPEEEDLFR